MSIPLSLLDFILLHAEFNFKTLLSRATGLNGLTFAGIICIIHNLLMKDGGLEIPPPIVTYA
jgi:hypothetical protein